MQEAQEKLSHADILVTYGDDVDEKVLSEAARLKWIMVMAAGIEHLPFQAIKEKSIIVTNARGIHKIPMAEFTIGMMLSYAKNIRQLSKNQERHVWEQKLTFEELAGKKATIIGPGAIGSEIARLLKAFRMETTGVNTSGRPVEYIDHIYKITQVNEALQFADYVISVLPATSETYHLINKDHFKVMKKEAVFINVGRGTTVNQHDLYDALKNKELAHAILDVFEEEPLPKNHPFWEMDEVTITPHISALTNQYQPRAIDIFKENLYKYINKENDFINQIDLDRGY